MFVHVLISSSCGKLQWETEWTYFKVTKMDFTSVNGRRPSQTSNCCEKTAPTPLAAASTYQIPWCSPDMQSLQGPMTVPSQIASLTMDAFCIFSELDDYQNVNNLRK
ncbi:uncharacterized protein LOC116620856 isoform X3 [Nematostella vectensis]|uniref:uncharacterized protein LOC116620856 isoform X3 n=1 Tax=Nematostella vectensis TaxID=45351 RepID=UPI00207708B5|nr:uncharacterized protein LOC116620856 isoform X3 [Nematostella vectensis]